MKNILDINQFLTLNFICSIGKTSELVVLLDEQEFKFSFVKGMLNWTPPKFMHPLYKTNYKQTATYILREIKSGSIYVGSSKEVYRRIAKHKTMISQKVHDNANFTELLKTAKLYDFELIIVFTDNREQAYDLEQIFVDHYKDKNVLLNTANDVRFARLGAKNSQEHKDLMSKIHTGRVFEQSTLDKMSHFHKTDEKAINQFKRILEAKKSSVMVHGVKYDSITQAGLISGYSESYIRRAIDFDGKNPDIYRLSDNISPLKGTKMSEDRRLAMSDFKKNDSKSIAQFKLASEKSKKKIIFNGVLYESITDLVRSIDIAESTIHIQLSRQGGKNDKDCYVLNYVKPLPRKVSISGKVFNSTADAAIALDIKRPILKSRIRSKANLDCFYINT